MSVVRGVVGCLVRKLVGNDRGEKGEVADEVEAFVWV